MLMADSLPISSPTTITLDSGVKVLLKPDHSWEYLLDRCQLPGVRRQSSQTKNGKP
ncbi:hypothetical protein [Cobetia sp. ICG0124]|uniref:hypothetical protein n=1 Tax=Cobetia sp. ICG0124 TaxID=2053669 RepID=UPI0013E327C5|nr:hypothetical protein [Cobetia sp. ICG0124]